jgi:tRNA (uracil-5-)-methyltransferase TRM9
MHKTISISVDALDKKQLEDKHVHDVYQVIGKHFSDTRYKPWPVVESFLNDLDIGSIGADVGCGNGKYLGVNPNVAVLGSDRSNVLLDIVRDRGFEAMICDTLDLPYRSESFDFALSIAVIHHLSSNERRLAALKELLRIIKPGGRLLVFVWALEQSGKRTFQTQDNFVSWSMHHEKYSADGPQVFQRYYHVFVKDELESLIRQTNMCTIVQSGYDRDNWFAICQRT